MSRGQRTAFLIAAAAIGALALSGAVVFRPRRREQVGEGSAFPSSGGGGGGFSWPWSSPLAPTSPAAPAPSSGAKLDEQWIVNGKKASILEKKKPATGVGPDGVANRTRGAGTGSGLQLDG